MKYRRKVLEEKGAIKNDEVGEAEVNCVGSEALESRVIRKCKEFIAEQEETEASKCRLLELLKPLNGKIILPLIMTGNPGAPSFTLGAYALMQRKLQFFETIISKHPEHMCTMELDGHKTITPLSIAVSLVVEEWVGIVLTNPGFLNDQGHRADIKSCIDIVRNPNGAYKNIENRILNQLQMALML